MGIKILEKTLFEKRQKPRGHKAYQRMTPKGKIAQVKEKPYNKDKLKQLKDKWDKQIDSVFEKCKKIKKKIIQVYKDKNVKFFDNFFNENTGRYDDIKKNLYVKLVDVNEEVFDKEEESGMKNGNLYPRSEEAIVKFVKFCNKMDDFIERADEKFSKFR